jgi:hypothetical protein
MPTTATATSSEAFAHVYADFELQGFMRLIGATFRVIAPGRTELETVRERRLATSAAARSARR